MHTNPTHAPESEQPVILPIHASTLPPPPPVSVWKVGADAFEIYHGGANPFCNEPLATLRLDVAPDVDATLLAKGLREAACQVEEFAKLDAYFGRGDKCSK